MSMLLGMIALLFADPRNTDASRISAIMDDSRFERGRFFVDGITDDTDVTDASMALDSLRISVLLSGTIAVYLLVRG